MAPTVAAAPASGAAARPDPRADDPHGPTGRTAGDPPPDAAAAGRRARPRPTAPPPDDAPAEREPLPEDRFLNRELSWLDFNARVLTLAEDPATPLLERAKFLAIFASNLDEFYMVRVAGLKRRLQTGLPVRGGDRLPLARASSS